MAEALKSLKQGIGVIPYLDDLLLAESAESLANIFQTSINYLPKLG